MFRRKPSPQESKRDRRSTGSQQNGHRGQDGEGDFGGGEADSTSSPPSRARAVTSPTAELNFQGRRLSPAREQLGEDVESALYVTPADTLNRSASHSVPNATGQQASCATGSGLLTESLSGSRSERKAVLLHNLTMNQWSKRQHGEGAAEGGDVAGSGSIVVGSKPHVVQQQDQPRMGAGESNYSVPFNLLASEPKPPPRPHHHHHSAAPLENSEYIIPINPPQSPSDRSDTTSPNSPQSNLSELDQHQQYLQPSLSRPPVDGDYAVPWDRGNISRNIPRVAMSTSRRPRDQPSPPLPLATSGYRYRGSGGGSSGLDVMNQIPPPPPPDDSPPPLDVPYDQTHPSNRPTQRARTTMSNRVHSNTSPVNAGGWGHDRPPAVPVDSFSNRSMSMSSNVQPGRPLPNLPGRGGGDWVPTGRMETAPPLPRHGTAAVVDSSIPLEDQP